MQDFDPIRFDQGDEPLCNPQLSPCFDQVLEKTLQRRHFLQGGIAAALVGLFGAPQLASAAKSASSSSQLLGFSAIATSVTDSVKVPEGYRVQVMLPWGEPITGEYPAFDAVNASNSAEDQAQQIGMHHDGMHFFPSFASDGTERSDQGLLVMNHEYVDWLFLHSEGPSLQAPRPREQVLKEMNAHGISVVEVRRDSMGQWLPLRSERNRRITPLTPMRFSGPARGHALLQTAYSPDGNRARGTMNNCSHGVTPWGTYLTCEENWAGYFANTSRNLPREQSRYGVRNTPGQLGLYSWRGWHTVEAEGDDDYACRRFDATPNGNRARDDFRNEPNTFGWIVEIDPQDPDSTPIKRTAMGRFAHEGVVLQPAKPGRCVVAYSGDDARYEYIYKYVSDKAYQPETANGSLLDEGTLYVARFDPGGRGRWIALRQGENGLTPERGFRDQAEVVINARSAADIVGATPMDRAEWGAVHPDTGEVYFTLTNNTDRSADNTDAANPRGPNRFGHIIRWREDEPSPRAGEHQLGFSWDVFVFGGDHSSGSVQGRPLDDSNIFAAPDGLWFDADGRLWIQTDIGNRSMNTGEYAVFGNNQMLCADPTNGDIRRFLVGPIGQEITGVVSTPDQRTLFVNVQHPGETTSGEQFKAGEWTSNWPGGGKTRPRSATLAISRIDGGKVGA